MKHFLPCLLFICLHGYPQGSLPWEHPLKMAWSEDGISFAAATIFQDSAGVPSMIKWKGDTLVSLFQWFRKPVNSSTWDKVAVKFSYDAGTTWTSPVPITVSGLPANYQRPFDPTLAVVNNGTLRVYFSSSEGMPIGSQDATINTYSAISSNGTNYTFEPNPRFDHPTNRVIDPAVIYFNAAWHYLAPSGAPQDGAYHSVSSNGLDFIQQSSVTSDAIHNWTGNFMINAPDELRFYGSGERIWFNVSSDGSNWQGYTNTSIVGGDPAVVRLSATKYLAIFVADRYITGVEENSRAKTITAFPNPFSDFIAVSGTIGDYHYRVYDTLGRLLKSGRNSSGEKITMTEIEKGLYFLQIDSDKVSLPFKLIKA